MPIRNIVAAAVLLIGNLSSLSFAEDSAPIKLRYQFQVGQQVRYDVIMNDDYRIELGESVDQPYSHQTSQKSYRVLSVNPDGSAELEMTIENVKLQIRQNDETLNFDSQVEHKEPLAPVFIALDNLVGKPHLRVTISPLGTVMSYKPLVAGDQVPNDPGSAALDVLFGLPEQPVKVGETWREDLTVNVALTDNPRLQKPVRVQRVYTLRSYENSIAAIEVQTRVLSVLGDASEELQMLRRKPKGLVVVDNQRGLLISKSMNQDNEVSGFETSASLFNFRQKQEEKLIDIAAAEGKSQTR